VLVIGGDGTAHETAQGILAASESGEGEVTLGILPIGTGNDWVRSLGIPHDLSKAVEILRSGRTLLSDVGTVACRHEGVEREVHFVNVAGLGFDAFVCDRRLRKERGGGRFHYLAEALRALPAYRPVRTRIVLPTEVRSHEVFLMAVGIGAYYGGGMRICPRAQMDDGLLAVTLVEPLPTLRALRSIPRLYRGAFEKIPEVSQFRTDRIEVNGDGPLLVTCDGEVVGEAPASFSIRPNCLRVVVRPDFPCANAP
jgi:YegS/Rv2252/BmrU family lipid kinase